jgi:hypothetical protein
MKRVLLALCTLAPALAAVPAAAQPYPAPALAAPVRLTKPSMKITAPVDIEIVPQADPGPGLRRVRIIARPSVDAAQMTLDVRAESGLVVSSLPAAWTLAAHAGEEVVREVDLAVSGPGELRLVVTVTVKYGEDFTQSGIQVFAFNPAPETGALTKSFIPSVPNQPGGRTILEVPARTP